MIEEIIGIWNMFKLWAAEHPYGFLLLVGLILVFLGIWLHAKYSTTRVIHHYPERQKVIHTTHQAPREVYVHHATPRRGIEEEQAAIPQGILKTINDIDEEWSDY